MFKFPVIKGIELVKFLESLGFRVTRTKGSHVNLRAEYTQDVTCARYYHRSAYLSGFTPVQIECVHGNKNAKPRHAKEGQAI
jgi:hypothetical protein